MTKHDWFSVQTLDDSAPSKTLITVAGELDVVTAPVLERLAGAELRSHRAVIIDLARVTFMDARAVHALVKLGQVARTLTVPLRISGTAPKVRRLFDLVGVEEAALSYSPMVTSGG